MDFPGALLGRLFRRNRLIPPAAVSSGTAVPTFPETALTYATARGRRCCLPRARGRNPIRGVAMARRYAKILMVLALAAFAFLVTFNNITDYGSNFAFVQHVLSMDTTFPGNA